LNTTDGSEKWHYQTAGAIIPLRLSLIIQSMSAITTVIFMLSIQTPATNLEIPRGCDTAADNIPENFFWAEPVVVNGVIYAPNLDGHVYALDTATGNWSRTFLLVLPSVLRLSSLGNNML